ncbi:M20 family metallopeptidase [Tepidanaerobacter syntrophicus]|uniref:Acetylornithine deacetylase n=1 Tax=Tepidanaerobacter syntrophicus TaxID=224999 RepID=A0A0U9HMI0_9FIRM|nr:M20/M25/M40 family metallo-hydrolase [Tepidanaerobacter syntrophicus]GAQ25279.1 acetylornithine deacetylase [Tepidanaerobacter syntrophicus]
MEFQENKEFTIDILKKLVTINSVTGNESEIGNKIFEILKYLGVDEIEKQNVDNDRFNIIARVRGDKKGPTTLLTGHLDTVPAGNGWETNPFVPVIKGDKVYGRGALDMKSGIAIILSTVKFAIENKDKMKGDILIALVPDEEATSLGITTLINNTINADFGIAAEPEYIPIIGSVGKLLIHVDAYGKTAHGCEPNKGINAIEEMARFLVSLGKIPLKEHHKIQKQPYVTLKIEGGFNQYSVIVPDYCFCLVNKHTVPTETIEYILEQMQELVINMGLKAKFIFKIDEPYYEPYEIQTDLPQIEKLCSIYKDVIGKPMEFRYGTGVCDNNKLVPATGIPVICLGAKGGGLHSENEWVSLKSMFEMNIIYQKYIFSF